jgi:hypothetical protein
LVFTEHFISISMMSAVLSLAILAFVFQCASAELVTTHVDASSNDGALVDGTIASGEYLSYSYSGGGTGFGGPLGNGTLYFESDATSLYVGASIAGGLSGNIIAVFLDTQAGGFANDSSLGDMADGGRRVASKLTRDVQDNFPVTADYVLEFGNGFTNVFRLKTGSLDFIAPTSAGSGGNSGAGSREASIPLSTLGITPGGNVDFFAVLISDTGFSSNEGIPNPNIGISPGFGSPPTPVNWPDYNRFTTAAIPEASAALAIPVAVIVAGFGRMVGRRCGRRPHA